MKILAGVLLLLLTACSTPEVVTKCLPPNLIIAEPLPSLENRKHSEQEYIQQTLQDVRQYNTLKLDHNALVKWIKERC